jgi:hypothetical protein
MTTSVNPDGGEKEIPQPAKFSELWMNTTFGIPT